MCHNFFNFFLTFKNKNKNFIKISIIFTFFFLISFFLLKKKLVIIRKQLVIIRKQLVIIRKQLEIFYLKNKQKITFVSIFILLLGNFLNIILFKNLTFYINIINIFHSEFDILKILIYSLFFYYIFYIFYKRKKHKKKHKKEELFYEKSDIIYDKELSFFLSSNLFAIDNSGKTEGFFSIETQLEESIRKKIIEIMKQEEIKKAKQKQEEIKDQKQEEIKDQKQEEREEIETKIEERKQKGIKGIKEILEIEKSDKKSDYNYIYIKLKELEKIKGYFFRYELEDLLRFKIFFLNNKNLIKEFIEKIKEEVNIDFKEKIKKIRHQTSCHILIVLMKYFFCKLNSFYIFLLFFSLFFLKFKNRIEEIIIFSILFFWFLNLCLNFFLFLCFQIKKKLENIDEYTYNHTLFSKLKKERRKKKECFKIEEKEIVDIKFLQILKEDSLFEDRINKLQKEIEEIKNKNI